MTLDDDDWCCPSKQNRKAVVFNWRMETADNCALRSLDKAGEVVNLKNNVASALLRTEKTNLRFTEEAHVTQRMDDVSINSQLLPRHLHLLPHLLLPAQVDTSGRKR